ncbi:MAG: OmpA family protein [Hyphomicrobiaceae bacterium]
MRRARQVVAAAIALVALLGVGWAMLGPAMQLNLNGFLSLGRGVAPDDGKTTKTAKRTGPGTGDDASGAPAKPSRSLRDARSRPVSAQPLDPVAIEVARIDAAGASVIAGRAPAGSKITVEANGQPVATTVASSDGQWAVVVSIGIAVGPLQLRVLAAPDGGGSQLASRVASLLVPEGKVASLADATPTRGTPAAVGRTGSYGQLGASTSEAGHHELLRFEEMVKQARREASAAGGKTPAPTPASARLDSAPGGLAGNGERAMQPATAKLASAGPSSAASGSEPAVTPFVPVPITFESDATDMTPIGARAADLLAEYLRLKKPAAITLTGHADARGTDQYNLDLSRRRLEAIEHHLRKAGYQGRLALIAKGKSEPYRAIDRKSLSVEQVWQADRRVELRLLE